MADTLVSKFQTISSPTSSYAAFDVGSFVTTVLSLVICNTDTDNGTFDVYIDPSGTATEDAGGTNTYIYTNQSLPAGSTFEHTDKIVLHANDSLIVVGNDNSPYPSMSISCTTLKQT